MTADQTPVAIVGAGPAGLLLSHLLARDGIESVVLDGRSREQIESTIRAGILEHDTVQVLTETGASSRVTAVGQRHDGIELRFGGEGHRIDFEQLVGRAVWLYPQHEVLKDLIEARLAAGQEILFNTTVSVVDDEGTSPRVVATNAEGARVELSARFVVGADGSRSVVREAVAGSANSGYFREYPFAWFGILCEAPPSAPELIYAHSPQGFALISQRSPTVQRMYFQCDPETDPESLTDDEIWTKLSERVGPHELVEGPIFQRDVLRFRSFVASHLQKGRVALVGDAAHTVPPTGAKGMNLAIADVIVLARALAAYVLHRDDTLMARYSDDVLSRIWKAQHFSWWMTSILHSIPGAGAFDTHRQMGELRSVIDSSAGQRFLAEGYTGWPLGSVTPGALR